MNAHLSDEQLARFLAGDEEPSARSHAAECQDCELELTRLLRLTDVARQHVNGAAGRDANYWALQRIKVRNAVAVRAHRRPTWALAAAMVILIVVSSLLFQARSPQQQPVSQNPAVMTDDALLAAVNSTLQQDVPTALEPVRELAYEREQAERNPNRKN